MRMLGIGLLLLCLASYASAQEGTITVLADGTPALALTVPPGTKVTPAVGATRSTLAFSPAMSSGLSSQKMYLSNVSGTVSAMIGDPMRTVFVP